MTTVIIKILPQRKLIWVRSIHPHYYKDMVKTGWKVFISKRANSSVAKCVET